MKPMLALRHVPMAVTAVALAVALSACNRGVAETPAAQTVPEVLTARARAADADYTMKLPARALAGETAQLYPRATGFVSERLVDLGDQVQSGQVLAVIATPEIDQSVREAQAEVGRARAALELARVNYDRAAVLVESGAVSRETYSDRSANRDAAQAALAAAQARLESARERQGFQRVRAPFAGVIAARYVDRGDRVVGDAASAVPLFEINALDPLRILVDVPQGAALQVRPGLKAEVSFPELPGERFAAEVVRSAQSISDDAGGMRVELRLPNPGSRIPAGMVGQVSLQVPRAAPAVIVPLSAISGPAGQSRVARVGADSLLEFRPVLLGRDLGGEVEVLDGLAVGDQVVLAPNALLQAGARVAVKPPPQPAR
ncbi:efflux RND transporter periplasmic adaptor subunit [Pseudoxanthomonas putridarboris]|uniref:Efflux RND transporter periplasmic adaptor subunit n=1 Tax=Pseudoxanthomonas putridarboris TaxID=752605 RepID=A0ABU9J2R0_9GAMM